MHGVKTFRFRYNDDTANEDEETDFEGTLPIPRVGDLLFRKGKTWEVTQAVPRRCRGRQSLSFKYR
jgi:hypothetical protein